jgi:DNA-binding NtrC family response regulator
MSRSFDAVAGSRPLGTPVTRRSPVDTSAVEAEVEKRLSRVPRVYAPVTQAPTLHPAEPASDMTPYRRERRACSKRIVDEAIVRAGGNKSRAARELDMSREGLYGALNDSPYYQARRAAGRS